MKIAIIGGGASGLACAISAARKAKENNISVSITVFEKKDRVGKKLLVTGNGRCNLTNMNNSCGSYFADSHFISYAIEKYDSKSTIEFFESMGLFVRSDSEGRVYPLSNQASSVLDVLRLECAKAGIEFLCSTEIQKINKTAKGFDLGNGITYDKVVLAMGGMAGEKSYNGIDLLSSLGVKSVKPAPSLTKIISDSTYIKALKGLRQQVTLKLYHANKIIHTESGELLFTDYGLSGIAIMQLSAYISRLPSVERTIVSIDLIPEKNFNEILDAVEKIQRHNGEIKGENLLIGFMPKRIGQVVLKSCNISPEKPIEELSNSKLREIVGKAKAFEAPVKGLRGFNDAQVMAGGADTSQFNFKTMEHKSISGLFACGEILNVDGLCGGYNLQWAWSSGRLCGESLIK